MEVFYSQFFADVTFDGKKPQHNNNDKILSTHESSRTEFVDYASKFPIVCGLSLDGTRRNSSFCGTHILAFDVDSGIRPDDFSKKLNPYNHAIISSVSHMLPKKNETAIPRFHVFVFLDKVIETSSQLRFILRRLNCILDLKIDTACTDCLRYFFHDERCKVLVDKDTDELLDVSHHLKMHDLAKKYKPVYRKRTNSRCFDPELFADRNREIVDGLGVKGKKYDSTCIIAGKLKKIRNEEGNISNAEIQQFILKNTIPDEDYNLKLHETIINNLLK